MEETFQTSTFLLFGQLSGQFSFLFKRDTTKLMIAQHSTTNEYDIVVIVTCMLFVYTSYKKCKRVEIGVLK